MNRILATAAVLITIGTAGLSSDIPTTNWGAVLKVPLDKVEEVEKGLIEWGNWIKETHPMGDEDLGLDSLTITKGNPVGDHVYYVIVECSETTEGSEEPSQFISQRCFGKLYKHVFQTRFHASLPSEWFRTIENLV